MTSKPATLPAILLAGPTAAGKTSLAIELAQRLSTEIVNADSMQVYRYMDIGTAKPTPVERAQVLHHLIDVADPDEPFDAAKYAALARPVAEAIRASGRLPLVTGGTGLYLKALLRGIFPGPPSSPAIKEALAIEEKERGLPALYAELAAADPQVTSRIHPNDRQRVLRAVEVLRASGKPISFWQSMHGFKTEIFPAVKIFVFRDREELYARIGRRVEQMIGQGFCAEVERLLSMGYGPELKPMQSLGYKEMVKHLQGEISLDHAVYLIQRETRHYAKRQFTWFKADPEYRWLHADDRDGILHCIEEAAGMK
jgi:tRNA dimethylallyltransferase